MITVKIPAAIRDCSPVVCVSTPPVGPDDVGDRGVVKSTEDGEVSVNGWHTPRSCWALVISDPTGAAHLAWWLLYQTPSRTPEQHAARLEAIGWTANGYAVHVDLAARGLGVGSVALGFLRDYAHHIVGVTNG